MKNKVCVVTGAASERGIGQGIAKVFQDNGGALVLIDIKTINGANKFKNALCIQCDISNEKGIQRAFKIIKQKYGTIDVLVNGAAMITMKAVDEASNDDWDNVLSVNVKGYGLMIKHAVKIMNKGGSIINIASVTGFRGVMPSISPYGTTKAAIIQLTRNAALDLYDKYGIRVNSVSPGAILTDTIYNMYEEQKDLKSGIKDLKKYEASLCRDYIIKTFGDPKDVGYACLYLASNESKYVTGTNIMVDGGYCAL